jgi:hypothetical protein
MRSRNRRRFHPQVETLEQRWTPSTTRPISDFLSAQGTTSLFPNGTATTASPPGSLPVGLPDEVGWGTSTATINNGTFRFARIDYTGQDAAFLGLNLGTTTTGSISELPLKDGRVQDTINLTTQNAFAWANDINNNLLFGYYPYQLAANPGLVPPVVNCHLQVVIDNPGPGQPLPDLVALVNGFPVPPGTQLVSTQFSASGTGFTPSGQSATLTVAQHSVGLRTPDLIRDFGFTAEVVNVQVHGGGSTAATVQAVAAPAVTPAMPRSISDFLSAQGTTSVFNFGVPGLPDETAWTPSTSVINSGNAIIARIDYTGQDAAFLGLNLGTTTSGTVSEAPLKGGGAQVTVNLQTHNAFDWAQKFNPATFDPTIPPPSGDLLFGVPPSQVTSANAALANSVLQVVYKEPALGAPFWDLVDLNLAPSFSPPPGYSLVSLSFHATAQGSTPTGQSATLTVAETGPLNRTPNLIRDFGFTAEVVDVHVNNGAAPAAAPLATTNNSSLATASSSPAHADLLDAVFALGLDDILDG